jgi:small multidrug resistance pump
MNAWLILAGTIVAEVIGTSLLTKSQGFSKPVYGIASIVIFSFCFWALSHVLTKIPVGVTYALWSGVGIALISIVGWLFLKQPLNAMQIACIVLILAGAVGLNLATKAA